MKSLLVLGVTWVNDSYPNIKYKLDTLSRLPDLEYCERVYSLDANGNTTTYNRSMGASRIRFALRILLGHLKLILSRLPGTADTPVDVIYVCYPGVIISACLGWSFFRRRYKSLYLDAFISLYDTVVNDRRLLKAESVLARLLYRLEKRAFESATTVIVDTQENAAYYSELYGISPQRFTSIPLSIPPVSLPTASADKLPGEPLRCVFVGTFVPLQGVPVLVEAIRLLADEPGIEFVFIGDGQDSGCLENYMEQYPENTVTWHRGHFPTEFVSEQIAGADLCLGVFGAGDKTQRVLPYKLYYYLAMSRPVLTAATQTAQRIAGECQAAGATPPFELVAAGDPAALASRLVAICEDKGLRQQLGKAAGEYYQNHLSPPVIASQLQDIIR
jgi:glycosyltransferase involved in cell wall biosynthesis